MAIQLKINTQKAAGSVLRTQQLPFRICFDVALANGYEVKDMTARHVSEFHRFLSDTVYKNLTVSEVDKLFLRKRGMADAPPVKYGDTELIHYGKDRSTFRIFGYYNKDGYFSICRIDGDHKSNRQ